MSIIDLSNLTFSAEQIRDVNELVFDEVVSAPEITLVTTLYPGIVFDREIGFLVEGGLLGKAGQGCNPTPQEWRIGTRKVKWEPKSWDIFIQDCWKDLEATAGVYALKTGVNISDFTSTDYMAIVVQVLSVAIKKFIIRLVWFNDTDAANAVVEELPTATKKSQTVGSAIEGTVYLEVTPQTAGAVKSALADGTVIYLNGTPASGNAVAGTNYYSRDDVNLTPFVSGGIITPGIDVDYFNIIDGLWKQLLTQITVNPAQRVVILENSGKTYSDQELDPSKVKDYLQKLKFKAPMILRGQTGSFIACTQSFYDAYESYLMGKENESTFTILLDGRKVLTFGGIPLIPISVWDEMIIRYENNGIRLNLPHRALFVIKENLAVGVDGADSFENIDVFYDKMSETVNIKAKGKADAKVLNPAMFQIAI
jgi:hypothetical protein